MLADLLSLAIAAARAVTSFAMHRWIAIVCITSFNLAGFLAVLVGISGCAARLNNPGSRTDEPPSQVLAWGDQGDGTFKNPILKSDFSDPEILRNGGWSARRAGIHDGQLMQIDWENGQGPKLSSKTVWLRVSYKDLDRQFAYSLDGQTFTDAPGMFKMGFQKLERRAARNLQLWTERRIC